MDLIKKLTLDEITNEHSRNLNPYLQKIKNTSYPPEHKDSALHRFLMDSDISIKPEGSEICSFLKGKCIFITGGTGFLGRALVEKLLRASKDIDTIFLLVREKKGKTQKERIEDIFSSVLFSCLSEMYPDCRNKISIIYGDMSRSGMGIDNVDRKTLIEKVNVIYHLAATTRFDEAIKVATAINVKGALEILRLAQECQRLESFVFCGTAYSSVGTDRVGNKEEIEEKFYEPYMKPEELIAIVDTFNDDLLKQMTPSLLGNAPNTYTLTKQVSEKLIETEGKGLPIALFRPSIVVNSYREPLKGWSDNVFGVIGLMIGYALGIVNTGLINEDLIADLVPVDFVINACIACSYRTAKTKNHEKVAIYNFTSYKDNPIKWGIFSNMMNFLTTKVGSEFALWYPSVIVVSSEWLYSILSFWYHTLPGYCIDIGLFILGKKLRMGIVYKKIDKFLNVIKFFSLNEFHFDNSNVRKLWDSLSIQDKKMFAFDLKNLDWQEQFERMSLGARLYILNESFNNMEAGRTYVRKLYFASILLRVLIFSLLAYLFYKLQQWIF